MGLGACQCRICLYHFTITEDGVCDNCILTLNTLPKNKLIIFKNSDSYTINLLKITNSMKVFYGVIEPKFFSKDHQSIKTFEFKEDIVDKEVRHRASNLCKVLNTLDPSFSSGLWQKTRIICEDLKDAEEIIKLKNLLKI